MRKLIGKEGAYLAGARRSHVYEVVEIARVEAEFSS
jgi:hypothetical protein